MVLMMSASKLGILDLWQGHLCHPGEGVIDCGNIGRHLIETRCTVTNHTLSSSHLSSRHLTLAHATVPALIGLFLRDAVHGFAPILDLCNPCTISLNN